MKVVVAPDSFGGTLSASRAAAAIAAGWRRTRPDDDVSCIPLADGGEGTLEVVAAGIGGRRHTVEVANPRGRPTQAAWLELDDGTAVVESARACGLALLNRSERNPLQTTTYGVGQLLEDVRASGKRTVYVGLGGSATVDGGAGAATALGLRLLRGDDSGLKVGGGNLADVHRVEERWVDGTWQSVEVVLWSDVTTVLADAAGTFGPQKGASPEAVARLEDGLERWADVVERDLGGSWRHVPGSGAAGGLGFGLAAVLGGRLEPGARTIADLLEVDVHLEAADLVVTGEGRLDATSMQGKVVGEVVRRAAANGIPAVAVVGDQDAEIDGLESVVPASPDGAGEDPDSEVSAAAQRLATDLDRACT